MDGTSFIIHNQAQFCRELLPLYYKHNNMASFVRQLNMYGFHKKVSVDAGGLKLDKDEMEFAHPCFMRSHAYLLDNIKRKIAESTRGVIKSPEVINRVIGDVKQMKGRQESLDTKLSAMKRENEALWRELAVLRQKHHKQQQIVNKLIQFLLTVVQSPGNRLGIKRRYNQLMLHDKAHHAEGETHHHHHHHHHKHRHQRQSQEGASSSVSPPVATATSPLSDEEGSKVDDVSKCICVTVVCNRSPVSPDLGLTMEQDTAAALLDEVTQSSTAMDKQQPEEEQQTSSSDLAILVGGGSNGGGNNDDVSQSSISSFCDVTSPPLSHQQQHSSGGVTRDITKATHSNFKNLYKINWRPFESENWFSRLLHMPDYNISLQVSFNNDFLFDFNFWFACAPPTVQYNELDSHLDSMQSDLDGLKELLSKESCTLDANTLLSLPTKTPKSKEQYNFIIDSFNNLFIFGVVCILLYEEKMKNRIILFFKRVFIWLMCIKGSLKYTLQPCNLSLFFTSRLQ
ncbi:hypothetical protein B566_EDAN004390 [Ephemera danica]|nr:hypothetical protein B566_EDAN004390 [Ephemera danica]